jgi:DNA polymerase IV
LLGITGTDLVDSDHAFKQLDLFSYEKDAKNEPLLKTISSLREKYGKSIIENAGSHQTEGSQNIGTGTSFNKDFLRTVPNKNEDPD